MKGTRTYNMFVTQTTIGTGTCTKFQLDGVCVLNRNPVLPLLTDKIPQSH